MRADAENVLGAQAKTSGKDLKAGRASAGETVREGSRTGTQ